MTTWIKIKNGITISPNLGVVIDKAVLELSPQEIKESLVLAYAHEDDELLVEAYCSGIGPLAGLGIITFEEYLVRLRDAEIHAETKNAKKIHTKIRRAEYSARQSQLVLALIESGMRYVCAHPDCDLTTDLTIDHIVPLSRGGTDDIDNLQFLCRPHNSNKGDKTNI